MVHIFNLHSYTFIYKGIGIDSPYFDFNAGIKKLDMTHLI